MVHRRVKRKRSRALVILLFPALIFISIVGWFMYSVDNQNPTQRKQAHRGQIEKDNVTLLPIVFEEQREIRIHNTISNR